MQISRLDNNAPPKSLRPSDKTPNTRHEKPSFDWLVSIVQGTLPSYRQLVLNFIPKRWK